MNNFHPTTQAYAGNIPSATNTIGGSIFLLYIVLALLLTGLIYKSLYQKFMQIDQGSCLRRKTLVFFIISVVSFITLSWNMASFLVYSYRDWCLSYRIPLPNWSRPAWGEAGLSWRAMLDSLHLTQWAISSTLFQDFAQEILSTDERMLWTKLALWWELWFAWWMGGSDHDDGIWMYYGLAQILPISFPQTLFFQKVLLDTALQGYATAREQTNGRKESPLLKRNETVSPGMLSIGCIVLPLFYASLLRMAPDVALAVTESPANFVCIIFALRILLVAPYMLRLANRESKDRRLGVSFWAAFFLIASADLVITLGRVLESEEYNGKNVFEIAQMMILTLKDGSAIATLGSDVLLAIGSSGLWLLVAPLS